MPNGFENDLNVEKELNELEEVLNQGGTKEMYRFFGRRIIRMEQGVISRCEKQLVCCESRHEKIEENQSRLWGRLLGQLPDLLKVAFVVYFLASLGIDILLYKDVI